MSESRKVEDHLESIIGSIGRWQILITLATSLLRIPLAWNQIAIVLLGPPVTFQCSNSTEKCASDCEHVFDSPIFNNTIVMEWDLVCEREWMKNMNQTIVMFGVLVGNILFGIIADRYGRRRPLLAAIVLQFIAGLFSSFAKDWYTFTIMRFLIAFSTGGTMIIGFVITMEIIGVKHRQLFGMLVHIPFVLGYASLGLIGYLTTISWDFLQLWLSLPTILFLSYFWFIPESPRWLMVAGKSKEAVTVLENAVKMNGISLNDVKDKLDLIENNGKINSEKKGTIVDLFRAPNLKTRTILLCFAWLSSGFCLFGLTQYIGYLSGSIFINLTLSGIMQLPGIITAIVMNQYLGRKKTMIISNFVTGFCVLTIIFISQRIQILERSLYLLAFLSISTTFSTLYIFAGELFPTVLRNTGMGICSFASRIGSMIAPFIVGLNNYYTWLPLLIFGMVPIFAGLGVLFLPETQNQALSDTVKEAEDFGTVKDIEIPTTPLNDN